MPSCESLVKEFKGSWVRKGFCIGGCLNHPIKYLLFTDLVLHLSEIFRSKYKQIYLEYINHSIGKETKPDFPSVNTQHTNTKARPNNTNS